jgi:hypothetical protein
MEKAPTSPFFSGQIFPFFTLDIWIPWFRGNPTDTILRHETREEGLLEAAKCSPPLQLLQLPVEAVVNGNMFPPSLRICFQHEERV